MLHKTHIAYASWIFGSILLLFLFLVFAFAPDTLPPFKHKILTYLTALMAGLFGFFLTGTIQLSAGRPQSSTPLNAAGGVALFVLMLWWWDSSATPVGLMQQVEPSSPVTIQVSNKLESQSTPQVKRVIEKKGGVETSSAKAGNSGLQVQGDLNIVSSQQGTTTIEINNANPGQKE